MHDPDPGDEKSFPGVEKRPEAGDQRPEVGGQRPEIVTEVGAKRGVCKSLDLTLEP
jgi:hypothetical protein